MAIRNLKQDHPLLPDIFDFYTCMRHQHKYVMFCWVPSHVGIQGNERVDVLAKLALNEAYTNIKIPYTDLVYYAKLNLRKNWQFFWDQQVQSKLHAVHPELGLWSHSSQERRRDELILCRLRIGHTYLTHRCNRLRCPLARMSGLQCINMGHNGHGINLYGVSMTLIGN